MVYPPTFVITGPDELGLKYISELLVKCGIPCGHQDFFNLALHHMMPEEYWGDASWFFAFTEEYQKLYQSIIVIEQTRDEAELIESLCKSEVFTTVSPVRYHFQKIFKDFPSREAGGQIEDQVKFIIDKCKIEANYSFNVKDMNSDLLAEIIRKIECPYKITKETLWEAMHTTEFNKKEVREGYSLPTRRTLADHAA
jgi:hypothetical protein